MEESEYELRKEMYRIGKYIRDNAIDEDEQEDLGQELIDASNVCSWCEGDDAAGCVYCGGSGWREN